MYEVNGWSKYAEQDDWELGCLPETSYAIDGNDRFFSESLEDLIEQLMNFCGVCDRQSVLLDVCGDIGRVDIIHDETQDGNPLSENEREQWREGRIRAWYVTYIFHIEHVTRKPVVLIDLLKDKGYYYE